MEQRECSRIRRDSMFIKRVVALAEVLGILAISAPISTHAQSSEGCMSHITYGDICPHTYRTVMEDLGGGHWSWPESMACISDSNPYGYYHLYRIVEGWTYYDIYDPTRSEMYAWWNAILPDGSTGAVPGPLIVDSTQNYPECESY